MVCMCALINAIEVLEEKLSKIPNNKKEAFLINNVYKQISPNLTYWVDEKNKRISHDENEKLIDNGNKIRFVDKRTKGRFNNYIKTETNDEKLSEFFEHVALKLLDYNSMEHAKHIGSASFTKERYNINKAKQFYDVLTK